jgi:tRNA(Ile)-lysidine synthase
MANSRKPRRASDLVAHVERILRRTITPGQTLLLGLSGGVDSVVLLDILARLREPLSFQLHAVHVNHQISPNARAWAQFCRELCTTLHVPLEIAAVDLRDRRGLGLEAAARAARYLVIEGQPADFVVFAQHLDDQAETVLLQLLRGAGAKGLAAMPELSARHSALSTHLLRPLLEISRAAIERHAREHGLRWVDDESNQDVAYDRNFMRQQLLPLIEKRFPAYRATLARASRNLAEAAQLLEDLAQMDAAAAVAQGTLHVAALRSLSVARAKNLLRHYLDGFEISVPAVRLQEMLRQLADAPADARVRITLGSHEMLRFHDRAWVRRRDAGVDKDSRWHWRGEAALRLDDALGTLSFDQFGGGSVSLEKLQAQPVSVRLRQGGERLRPDCNRPRRSLKSLLQEAALPPWQRERLPLLFSGEKLVCVPGIGVDCDFQAGAGEPALSLRWDPD